MAILLVIRVDQCYRSYQGVRFLILAILLQRTRIYSATFTLQECRPADPKVALRPVGGGGGSMAGVRIEPGTEHRPPETVRTVFLDL